MTGATGGNRAPFLKPLADGPAVERWTLRLATAAASAAAYLLCLPWDLRNRPEHPGDLQETTPVTGSGVAALAMVLLALGGYLGARDGVARTLALVAAPPIILMLISLATHEGKDASPWPVAWVFFSALIAGGVLAAAVAGRVFLRRDTPGS
ncbi:hypothetical protein ACFQVC_13810 [Streptomyces monticola]|uniref:Integral membrane protein n=1 Tax=Streptomyces monticola TaxID=2666263 RepID=A0ABW2JH26_9ACTN